LSSFKLYHDGGVHVRDSRVKEPVSFAQVTDLHMHPPPDLWPEPYRAAITHSNAPASASWQGMWRHVRIDNRPPPKSLRQGEP